MTAEAPDLVLDFDVVLDLARKHLPSAQAVTAVDETGGEARAYVLDEKFIFKTQRAHKVRPRTSLQKAALHQDLIAKLAPEVSVPRVLGYGRDGAIEYVLETRMPGVAARNVELEGDDRRKLLFDLGRSLRRIHGLPLAPFEESGLFPGDAGTEEVRGRIVQGLQQAVEALRSQADPWPFNAGPATLIDQASLAIESSLRRVALHSNPGPEHVFLDPISRQFTGMIDFGDAYISHPAFDMRRWTTPVDRLDLLEGYRSEETLDPAFLGTWNAVLIGSLLATVAGLGPGTPRPERRQAAMEDLRILLSEL